MYVYLAGFSKKVIDSYRPGVPSRPLPKLSSLNLS